MKIAVIGAAGKAGSQIADEARMRDHTVTAIVRENAVERLRGTYNVLVRDLFDLTVDDLREFDIVVDAFGSPMGNSEAARQHVSSMAHLISIMEQLPQVRLMVVGGAGSLYTDETKTARVVETIPEAWREVPCAMMEAFEMLQKSKVNWTYFSPAAQFDPVGKRTGHYIVTTDVKIMNPEGKSYISYADYAVAMVDEMTNARFCGKRFTAVSDTSYNYIERMTFDITAMLPFKRKGSHFGVFSGRPGNARERGGLNYGAGMLCLNSLRGNTEAPDAVAELLQIAPAYQGRRVEFAVITSPTELIMRTAYGEIRCCFAESDMLYIKGERGLSLRVRKDYVAHEMMKPRGAKAWESMNNWRGCCLLLNPIHGSIDMSAPWDIEKMTTPVVEGFVQPDENGCFLLAVDETEYSQRVRDSYPTYAEALADANAEWESFLQTVPHFSSALEERRLEAAYILYSHIVNPAGRIRRPMMYMFWNFCGSQWQMSHHALALHRDLNMAMNFMMIPLDEASPQGQLPDFYDDSYGCYQSIKPPVQGWALKWIMRFHDLSKEMAPADLRYLYDGLAKWGDWFMTYRDDDHDGIPQYEHGDDAGLDDNSVFKYAPIMETPDLCAYLGLLFEALGDIAGMLGLEASVAENWYARSREIIDLMIKTFWKDGRFVALVNGTHEEVRTDSILYYMPLVLGKRLPQEIIDKMAADLSVESDWLTNYGLASEKLDSVNFKLGGSCGGIWAPVNLMLLYGLYDAGEQKLAKKIALRYCTAIKDGGFAMLMNPFSGSRGAGGSGSWPASAYIALADLCCNM